MDTTTPHEQNLADAVAAALSDPLDEYEERELALLQQRTGDPEVARRALDAARAVRFLEEEDLPPGVALDYQVRAFGELHGREHGGTWHPGQPIDLDTISQRIPPSATQPLAALAVLASVGGGRAHQLRGGLLSLDNTSDSLLGLCAVDTGEHLQLTAWTTETQHPYRRWWLRAALTTPAKASEITFAVAAPEHAPVGAPTVFTEQSGALLGMPVAAWCTSRRSGNGAFRAPIHKVGPADVPSWSDVVAAQ